MVSKAALLATFAFGIGVVPALAQPICTAGSVRISVDFPAGGRHTCIETEDGRAVLAVTPENKPINSSPWYAFKLETDAPTRLKVVLAYDGTDHRYHPKWTRDGQVWKVLSPRNVDVDDKNDRATFLLDLDRGMTVVAAQAIETPEAMLAWARNVLLPAGFKEVEYGKSIEGRPLVGFVAGGEAGQGVVVALTRQHPPETTGAAAFRAFVERIVANDDAAKTFRAKNRILLGPMMNPDGVVNGNWRHNMGGVDINRDWGIFKQPETRTFAAFVEAQAKGEQVVAWLDFHSTDRSVVYGPPKDNTTPSAGFTDFLRQQFEASLPIQPDWTYNAKNPGASKNWALETLKAPGMTVELDDNVSPDYARKLGAATADAVTQFFGK